MIHPAIGRVCGVVSILASCAVATAQQSDEWKAVAAFLRISRGDGDMPMNDIWLCQIIASDGVFGEACREVLKSDVSGIDLYFSRAADASDNGKDSWNPVQVFGRLNVQTKRDDVTVDQLREIARATAARFAKAIDRLTSGEHERLEQALERSKAALLSLRAEAATTDAQRRELLNIKGLEVGSPDAIRKVVSDLRAQKDAIDLQLVGRKARTEALTQRIAELAAAARKAGESDAIATELSRVLEAREAALAREKLRQNEGLASQQSLLDAMAQVAAARADVLRARSAAGAAVQEQMSRLNAELLSLSVDAAEAEARRAHIDSRLDEIRSANLVEKTDRADELARRLASLRANISQSESELVSAQERVEQFQRAAVDVIGLE